MHLSSAVVSARSILLARASFIFTLIIVTADGPLVAQDGDQTSAIFRNAVERIAPSVVRIESTGSSNATTEKRDRTVATGLVVGEAGWIMCAGYSLANEPQLIFVTTSDGERYPAKIVSQDHSRHLTLLKIETRSPLTVPVFVAQNDLSVGQWTLGIGRVLSASQPSVSVGVLSAKGRIWGKAIQCDAKISSNNYGGPLIDWQGRVMGVLVPMSPQSDVITAGAEWYDSGIGFAVPSDDVLFALPYLQDGRDLHSGKAGLQLRGKNQFIDPVIVGSVHPGSPAAKAGLKVGDQIRQVNDQAIDRHLDFLHALRPRYAGETITLSVDRGNESLRFEMELAEKLEPYSAPFIGVLADRPYLDNEPLKIRYTFAESAAAAAGLRAGDLLLEVAGQKVFQPSDVTEALGGQLPGDETSVVVSRDGQLQTLQLELQRRPHDLVRDIPLSSWQANNDRQGNSEPQQVRLPESALESAIVLPAGFRADHKYGLLLWLAEPGPIDAEALTSQWQAWADTRQAMVLAIPSHDDQRWQGTDLEFLNATLKQVLQDFTIDDNRVAIAGYKSGGGLAMAAAIRMRESIRGVVAIDGPVVRDLAQATPIPLQPLSLLFLTRPDDDRTTAVNDELINSLRERGFTVGTVDRNSSDSGVDEVEMQLIGNWFETVDAF